MATDDSHVRLFTADFAKNRTEDSLVRLARIVRHPDARPQADGSLVIYGTRPVPAGGLHLPEVMVQREKRP